MKRERYNTTLMPESRKKLRVLTALHNFKNENEMVEYMIEQYYMKIWENNTNEMDNENNK